MPWRLWLAACACAASAAAGRGLGRGGGGASGGALPAALHGGGAWQGGAGCNEALRRLGCAAGDPRCAVCAGRHQRPLRVAGCSDADVRQFCGGAAPANLLRNGGFEVGRRGWGVAFEIWAGQRPELDTSSTWSVVASKSEAAQGDRALCVATRAPAGRPGALAPQTPVAEVMSDFFQAEENSTLTFSTFARASTPLNVTLIVRYQPQGMELTPWDQPTLDQTVALTTEWQRYSLTTQRLPHSQNNAYAAGMAICTGLSSGTGGKRHCYGSLGAQKDVEVWMDGASAVSGRSADYRPHSALEVGGRVGDANGLHEPGTPALMETIVHNTGAQSASVLLSTTVLGPGYQRVMATQRAVTVPAESSLRVTPTVMTALLGPHRAYLSVNDAATNSELASDRFTFGILRPATPATQPNPRSRFGCNVEASPNFTHSLRLVQKIGFGKLRLMQAGYQWQDFERQPGHWDDKHEQTMHAFTDLTRSFGLEPTALVGRGIPLWAQAAGLKGPAAPPADAFLQQYGQFLTRLATSFRGKIEAFETWNEPNDPSMWYTGTPAQMARLLEVQHGALHAGNPEAKVVALSVQKLQRSEEFLQQVMGNLTAPASQFWDVLSWHPYRMQNFPPAVPGPEASPDPLRGEVQRMAKDYSAGKELWTTEFGFKIASKFAPGCAPGQHPTRPPGGFTIYANWGASPPYSEEQQAIFYVQQVLIMFANGVSTQQYYQLDEGMMTDRWAFGMAGRNQAYMKAAYFAAAQLVRKVDRAESFAQESLEGLDDAWLTTVYEGGAQSLVIWKAAGAVDLEIETPLASLVVADMFGNAFTLHPMHGKAFLTLTEAPMYIGCKRADLSRVGTAGFQLAGHAETVAAGATTSSLSLRGVPPAGCAGVVQAGFLSANSSVPAGALGVGANVVVPASGAVLGETFEAVLWLVDAARPGAAVGRLASAIRVVRGSP